MGRWLTKPHRARVIFGEAARDAHLEPLARDALATAFQEDPGQLKLLVGGVELDWLVDAWREAASRVADFEAFVAQTAARLSHVLRDRPWPEQQAVIHALRDSVQLAHVERINPGWDSLVIHELPEVREGLLMAIQYARAAGTTLEVAVRNTLDRHLQRRCLAAWRVQLERPMAPAGDDLPEWEHLLLSHRPTGYPTKSFEEAAKPFELGTWDDRCSDAWAALIKAFDADDARILLLAGNISLLPDVRLALLAKALGRPRFEQEELVPQEPNVKKALANAGIVWQQLPRLLQILSCEQPVFARLHGRGRRMPGIFAGAHALVARFATAYFSTGHPHDEATSVARWVWHYTDGLAGHGEAIGRLPAWLFTRIVARLRPHDCTLHRQWVDRDRLVAAAHRSVPLGVYVEALAEASECAERDSTVRGPLRLHRSWTLERLGPARQDAAAVMLSFNERESDPAAEARHRIRMSSEAVARDVLDTGDDEARSCIMERALSEAPQSFSRLRDVLRHPAPIDVRFTKSVRTLVDAALRAPDAHPPVADLLLAWHDRARSRENTPEPTPPQALLQNVLRACASTAFDHVFTRAQLGVLTEGIEAAPEDVGAPADDCPATRKAHNHMRSSRLGVLLRSELDAGGWSPMTQQTLRDETQGARVAQALVQEALVPAALALDPPVPVATWVAVLTHCRACPDIDLHMSLEARDAMAESLANRLGDPDVDVLSAFAQVTRHPAATASSFMLPESRIPFFRAAVARDLPRMLKLISVGVFSAARLRISLALLHSAAAVDELWPFVCQILPENVWPQLCEALPRAVVGPVLKCVVQHEPKVVDVFSGKTFYTFIFKTAWRDIVEAGHGAALKARLFEGPSFTASGHVARLSSQAPPAGHARRFGWSERIDPELLDALGTPPWVALMRADQTQEAEFTRFQAAMAHEDALNYLQPVFSDYRVSDSFVRAFYEAGHSVLAKDRQQAHALARTFAERGFSDMPICYLDRNQRRRVLPRRRSRRRP